MSKFMKNKFLFIILISIVTLVLLVVGAITLYKDNSLTFKDSGYIIETTTKKNAKYYFSANTKYKENVDEQITFKDSDSKQVTVDPASFVHYSDNSISFLQRGALVNLNDITSPMISYYNVSPNNIITYNQNKTYTVSSNGSKINIDAFIGRISDNKYIIAGSNLSLKVPENDENIEGEYFELLFIEDGIAQIDNQEASYKVTAQGSYFYIGDKIVISLGDEKIYYEQDAKMILSQITINGDENIDLDSVEEQKNETGTGNGNDTEGEEGSGDSTNDNDEEGGNGAGGGSGSGIGEGDSNETPSSTTNNGNANNSITTAQIELIKAETTSTTLNLSFQLNNASLINGTLTATLVNVQTGEKEYSTQINKVNGTFEINKESLSPDTEYALTIIENDNSKEKQYFQKTFKTDELGVTLEKNYSTADTLSYNIVFNENTDATKVRVSIYDNNGSNIEISPNSYEVSVNDISSTITFSKLKSNTSYSVSVDAVWINNAEYSNVYTINRIDTTLKKTPTISGINVTSNSEEIKFTIKADKIDDPDNGITSYVYYIYKADDITIDNQNPTPVYSVTKNDADELILNLNEITELKTGIDYRCKMVALYYDNEMTRESSSDYSSNFLIKSKPTVNWELKSTTINKVTGTITLIDPNCIVPLSGRTCLNKSNTFTLRYYKMGEDETTDNDRTITFDPNTLKTNITISDLSSNTTYAVKVFGNYYDDEGLIHSNVQLGDTFYITTDASDNIKFKIIGDNISGQNKDGTANSANVVTFDAMLSAPQDSNIMEEVSKITMNLYSGSYNSKDKLIGTYTITDKSIIEDLFNNYTITNSLFTNTTEGKLDSLSKLIKVTNNVTNSLNGAYTVEIESVYDSTGRNKITVEDNIYTFKLTPSYYLDTRIATNYANSYINVTTITKENLTEDEYTILSKTVSNLDELNKDTIVGITIDNSLSDAFVDSAFTYEKVIVDYIIYNTTTNKEVKRISVDMGNKYQPKTQTVYLDSGELDDGNKYFTRGYNYKVSYELNFTTEKGDNPTYRNDKLSKTISIERQAPIYTQYISTSTTDSITYKYSMTDIDNALYDNNFCYSQKSSDSNTSDVTDNTNNNTCLKDSIITDGDYHNLTLQFTDTTDYTLYYNKKDTSNKSTQVSITSSIFEPEYKYDNNNAYTIVDDKDNKLKIKLESNAINDRSAAYRVDIKATDDNSIPTYTRYFLASMLNEEETITEDATIITKYIAIDYANISRFMTHNLSVSVYTYYDSGLIGINQTFNNGLILKNASDKYLTIYNGSSSTSTTTAETNDIRGIYKLKENYIENSTNMYLYNHLYDTEHYNKLTGSTYYESSNIATNIGKNFKLTFTNNGITFADGSKEYSGYNVKVLKEETLETTNNTYIFNSITPKISVNTNGSTINSLKINVTPTGIYGNNQFTKNGKTDNKIYVDIYNNEDLTDTPVTLESNITITGNDEEGYSATIDSINYENLIPDTTYYFKIYAYIEGRRQQLFDSSVTNDYVTTTYSGKTLGKKELLSKIKFNLDVTDYINDTSQKELTWQLGLKDNNNYKLRFELYDEEDKPVNFDGTKAINCDKNVSGTSDNGYVANCYIQVAKENISDITNVDSKYYFTGDSFVFGGNYYKLYIYAIPYTNNDYDENNKLLLYENDALTTINPSVDRETGKQISLGMTQDQIKYEILIPSLDEATFNLSNTLESDCTNNICYISFTPTITDNYYVIKYGTYTAKLLDSNGKTLEEKTNISVNSINNSIVFNNLATNTMYYVELSYETYRNNYGYTETQKVNVNPFTDFIYTPISGGISLGTITASQSGNKNIILSYTGASKLTEKIIQVDYTITLKGGGKTSGGYTISNTTTDNIIKKDSIFEISTDKTPRLNIDLNESSDTSFTLKSGNTYIITTQYWYLENGKLTLLADGTFTTMLNL